MSLVLRGDAIAQPERQESIAIGQLVQGVLSRDDGDDPYRGHHADFYLIQGYAGQRVEILMTSEVVDTYLVLQDPAGIRLLDDDDGAGNLDSRILVTLPIDGLYTVIATSYTRQQGPYELLVREFHPVPVTYEALEEGRQVHGALSDSDATRSDNRYVDGYQFEGEMGEPIRLVLTSPSFDAYLYLLAPTGELLAENDDRAGDTTDSEINLQLQAPGSYRVLVTSMVPALGEYTIELSQAGHEPIRDQALTFGEPTVGQLDDDDGTWSARGAYGDGYTFEGRRGLNLEVSMTSSDIDTYLVLLGPDGTVIAENDDSGGTLQSLIHTTLPSDGSYRLIATSYSLQSGAYVLTANERNLRPLEPRRLRLGRRLSAELSSDDPMRHYEPAHVDLYEVDLDLGQRLVVSMSSTVINSYLWVVAPSGEVVGEDDDSGGGLDALVELTAPYEGTYLVVATTYPGLTGPYEISAEDAVALGTSERESIALGESLTGRLEHGDGVTPGTGAYRDSYDLQVEAGTEVEIRMESVAVDAYLQLLGPNGILVTEDDDSGSGLNSRIQTILPEEGRYVIYATSYQPAIGDYTLAIERFESQPVEPTEIAIGDLAQGRLELEDARSVRYGTLIDVYELVAEQGQSVQISMTSAALDAYLIMIDPNGEVVGEDDDSGGGLNARIVVTLPMSGTYRILATSAAYGEGAYQLGIEQGPATSRGTPFHSPGVP